MHNDTASNLTSPDNRLIVNDDAEADRITFYWTAGFMAAAFLVTILSSGTELEKSGGSYPLGKIFIYELTGFGLLLALYPAMTRLVSEATPGQHPWRNVIAIHFFASIAISIMHMAAFVTARKILIPLFYDQAYIFTDNILRDSIYEYRKSALAYVAIIVAITFGRILSQQRKELAAAREDARNTKKLTLKCGGRTILLDAANVRWVKSAANYVEVAESDKIHFARSTLAGIERQLTEAGANIARSHRSHIINMDYVSEITPTGEGDVRIKMTDGQIVPGSRRYRDRIQNLL